MRPAPPVDIAKLIALTALTRLVPRPLEVPRQTRPQTCLQVRTPSISLVPRLPLQDDAERRPDRQVIAGPEI